MSEILKNLSRQPYLSQSIRLSVRSSLITPRSHQNSNAIRSKGALITTVMPLSGKKAIIEEAAVVAAEVLKRTAVDTGSKISKSYPL